MFIDRWGTRTKINAFWSPANPDPGRPKLPSTSFSTWASAVPTTRKWNTSKVVCCSQTQSWKWVVPVIFQNSAGTYASHSTVASSVSTRHLSRQEKIILSDFRLSEMPRLTAMTIRPGSGNIWTFSLTTEAPRSAGTSWTTCWRNHES